MKRYKVHEVIEMLEADGWFLLDKKVVTGNSNTQREKDV